MRAEIDKLVEIRYFFEEFSIDAVYETTPKDDSDNDYYVFSLFWDLKVPIGKIGYKYKKELMSIVSNLHIQIIFNYNKIVFKIPQTMLDSEELLTSIYSFAEALYYKERQYRKIFF